MVGCRIRIRLRCDRPIVARTMIAQPTPVRGYKDLHVWQIAMDLVVEIYHVTTAFPRHETYGLAVQLRKAAVSVPANVAEGHGREHPGDYLHHLSIANGSLMELETHCLIAERLRYITQEDVAPLLKRTGEL